MKKVLGHRLCDCLKTWLEVSKEIYCVRLVNLKGFHEIQWEEVVVQECLGLEFLLLVISKE